MAVEEERQEGVEEVKNLALPIGNVAALLVECNHLVAAIVMAVEEEIQEGADKKN
jgi:hypothetical protein